MAVPANAIKEANEQILLMHSRMQEMEKQITELNKTLAEKDGFHVANSKIPVEIQQSIDKKDAQVQSLRHNLHTAQEKISNLEQDLLDKEVYLEKLESKAKILDEVVGFRGSLEGLLSYMKIVQEMDQAKNNVSDINDNLRETEITDGYKSEEEQEHTGKTTNVVNGLPLQSENKSTIEIDHV